MNIEFDNNYQLKYMVQRFATATIIDTPASVQQWRQAWLQALSSWHSPYKAVIDCSKLKVASGDAQVTKDLATMLRFFRGFHLRDAIGFGLTQGAGHESLPFKVLGSEEDAFVEIGIRQPRQREASDFRATIQLQNHFQTHVVELSFLEPVRVDTKDHVKTLKSKIMNNLMQWHSKWSLLIDCSNLEIDPSIDPDFDLLFRALKGFFLKTVVGYSPRSAKDSYPFDVYRSRHRAVALLEGEGNFSGDKAECQSRRKAPVT